MIQSIRLVFIQGFNPFTQLFLDQEDTWVSCSCIIFPKQYPYQNNWNNDQSYQYFNHWTVLEWFLICCFATSELLWILTILKNRYLIKQRAYWTNIILIEIKNKWIKRKSAMVSYTFFNITYCSKKEYWNLVVVSRIFLLPLDGSYIISGWNTVALARPTKKSL